MPSTNTRRIMLWSGVVVAVAAIVFGGWIFSLPAPRATGAPPPIAAAEAAAILEQLKPPKRARPVIAIVAINDATEVTDYVLPYGILRRAEVAEVVTLATGPGPVKLFPALTVEPHATLAQFDRQHPDGADYVVVPAMSRDDDPVMLKWLQDQAKAGALIVGVCAGAKVMAEAGLLDGKRATTHWYYVDAMVGRHPSIQHVPDRRLVIDRGVATTTGITASIPLALTMIEAIAGREKAESVAREVGVPQWDARHSSAAFQFTRPFALTVLRNTVPFWNREELGIELTPAVDEVSLALVADAWSRTYRSRALTFSPSAGPHESRYGIRIVPDRVGSSWPEHELLPAVAQQPGPALDGVLGAIATRYGDGTASLVAMQLEYPMRSSAFLR